MMIVCFFSSICAFSLFCCCCSRAVGFCASLIIIFLQPPLRPCPPNLHSLLVFVLVSQCARPKPVIALSFSSVSNFTTPPPVCTSCPLVHLRVRLRVTRRPFSCINVATIPDTCRQSRCRFSILSTFFARFHLQAVALLCKLCAVTATTEGTLSVCFFMLT